MALKVGPDRFYQYIRGFGFGSRTGIQLPSETRGLLRNRDRWNPTSIGYLAIGHEVAVTPLQLVTMVSTIANGGTYLPPRILLNDQRTAGHLAPSPFRAAQDLPQPLPDGARRVITPLTSARMRTMMEGVVLEGTGRPAALNGYTAGGKTGTAQKIDPVTHVYSHTLHVASFAGFAPVNNPAISVAVIIDAPRGSLQYGTAVAAPIFREVAQQILEYLGVPHDEPVQTAPEPPPAAVAEDTAGEDAAALQQIFAQVNDLPADDPLRQPAAPGPAAVSATGEANGVSTAPPAVASAGTIPPPANDGLHDSSPAAPAPAVKHPAAPPAVAEASRSSAGDAPLVTDERHRVAVPSFAGQSMREVVEHAGTAGLAVQVLGNGLARAQAPAAGTRVPLGTQVVVRFTR